MRSRLSAKAGLAIRKLRLARGWTLAQLGEKAGVPLSTLSKVELGQTSLSYENLLRICRGLEIDMERLIGAEADGEVGAAPASPAAVGRRAVARAGDGDPIHLPCGSGRIAGGELIRKAFTPVIIEVTAADLGAHGDFHRDEGEADGEVGAAPASPAAVGRRAVARAGDGDPIHLPCGPGRIAGGELIRKAFTPVVIEVTAADLDSHGEFRRDEGEAYVMVLDGALAMHSEHYAPLKLQTGDGVYFDARAGYALIRDGATPCRALVVFSGDRQG